MSILGFGSIFCDSASTTQRGNVLILVLPVFRCFLCGCIFRNVSCFFFFLGGVFFGFEVLTCSTIRGPVYVWGSFVELRGFVELRYYLFILFLCLIMCFYSRLRFSKVRLSLQLVFFPPVGPRFEQYQPQSNHLHSFPWCAASDLLTNFLVVVVFSSFDFFIIRGFRSALLGQFGSA